MHLLSPDINFCWFPGNFFRSDILEFLQFVAACKRSVAGVKIFYGSDICARLFRLTERSLYCLWLPSGHWSIFCYGISTNNSKHRRLKPGTRQNGYLQFTPSVCLFFFPKAHCWRSVLLHHDRRTIRKYSIYFGMPEMLQQCFWCDRQLNKIPSILVSVRWRHSFTRRQIYVLPLSSRFG